jgi:hypothetical protein
MDRYVHDKNILSEFCEKFCNIIDKYTDYIIVSGFVAISSGRIRGTEDIDMIIKPISINKFIKFHNELIKNDFVSSQSDNPLEIYEYLKEKLSIRYTLKNKPVPEMEIKFAKDELDNYQIKNKIKIQSTGLDVWFSSINTNIAFKEELLKSQKDIEDANHLRIVFSEIIDEKEINSLKKMIRRYRL